MSRTSGKKTFTDSKGKRRHSTKWQQLVSKHGVQGAKKHYAGYKQRPAPPTTTGGVSSTSKGTRRVKDNKIGGGGRSVLYYKGDRVGTWAKSRGTSNKGSDRGKGWYMERGYGTPRNPVPDTKLSRRLGIAGKTDLMTGHPSALYEDWEQASAKKGKAVAEAESFEAQKYGKRQAFDMPGGRRFVARNSSGQFISNVDAGRSISADKRKPAKSKVRSGFGQMGDIRSAESVASRISSWEDKNPGYKIQKPNPNSTGYMTMTKSGPRRVNDTNIGGHGRYGIYHKGDRVGTWTPSKGASTKGGNTGLAWFMERGYGTPRKPVPDTPLTRRLGIANKGRQLRGPRGLFGKLTSMLAPGAVPGLNSQQDWETRYNQGKLSGMSIMEAESVQKKINRWERKNPGYKIVKPNPNSTGYLTMTKSGPRRVNDTNIGGHGRYAITHGGDRVGTWTPSGGSKKSGANTGLGWYMERGYGTPRKPVPDTPLARRLGIANKGRQMRDARGRFGPMTSILAPGAIAGLNENQDWEQNYHNSRMGGQPVMENQMPMMEDEEEEQGSIFGDMFDRDYSDMDMGPGGARESTRGFYNNMFKRRLNADEEPTDEEIEMERMADKARRRHGKSRQGITQRKALRQYLQRRKSAEEEEEEDYDY
jgi:hypothetical protein